MTSSSRRPPCGKRTILFHKLESQRFVIGCRGRAPQHGIDCGFCAEREFLLDNLLVRIHLIIEMIWWTGLAPWEFELPFPGSLTYTFREVQRKSRLFLTSSTLHLIIFSPSLLLLILELSDTRVYEPSIRALLETAAHFCKEDGTVRGCGQGGWGAVIPPNLTHTP